MTEIITLKNLTAVQEKQVVRDKLTPAIHAVLDRYGQLDLHGLQYMLEGEQDLRVVADALKRILSLLLQDDVIEKIERSLPVQYRLADNKQRPIILPVPVDYVEGYYGIYLRYLAIRENPELATMAESYIDALYNQRMSPPQTLPGGDVET